NLERAELAYREVLRRMPNDVSAQERLVDVYQRAGNGAKAIETQQALVQSAPNPETKRRRIIELSRLHETALSDVKKAESILDAPRKVSRGPGALRPGVAGPSRPPGRGPAVQVLLDRAATDARRALSTGRFDISLFSMLAAVARLRDRLPSARIAEATVTAI